MFGDPKEKRMGMTSASIRYMKPEGLAYVMALRSLLKDIDSLVQKKPSDTRKFDFDKLTKSLTGKNPKLWGASFSAERKCNQMYVNLFPSPSKFFGSNAMIWGLKLKLMIYIGGGIH